MPWNETTTMELLTDLDKGLKKGEKSFISTYLEIEDNLIEWYNTSHLLKSDIYINQKSNLKI
jgi:hypothetical protein